MLSSAPTARAPIHPGMGAGVVIGILVACAIGTIALPAGGDLIGPLGTLIGFVAAAIAILRRSGNMEGRDRIAWRLIGVGFVLACTGMLTIVVLEVVAGPVPAFGPADLFFVAAYLTILAGFSYLPHQATSPLQRVRVYLDSLIGALSVAAVMWVLVLHDLLAGLAGASGWERWAGSAYPLLDVATLIVVVIVVSRRSAFRFDPRLLLFGLGVAIQSYADLEYLRAGVGRSFGEVEPNFTAFVIAATLYYLAAVIADRTPRVRSYADRPASVWSMIGPYGAAALLGTLAFVEAQLSALDADGRIVLGTAVLVGGLVVIRQSVAIHENRRALDRQRAELIASISHELRTPLTAIVGFLDELTDGTSRIPRGEREELLRVVAEEARYLERLVADLAPLRSEGSGALTLHEEPVDVADVVQRSIALSLSQARVDVDDGLTAIGDPHRIQQALVNLLSNARRYGGGRVLVEGRRRGDDVVLAVHDDGPGIPVKWELAIWDKFERGANRYNATQPGSGIGLAMVAAIVAAHGGTRAYRRSELLGGACFEITLTGRIAAAPLAARSA